MSSQSPAPHLPPPRRRRSTWKSLLFAVVLGVVLGTLLSAAVVFFRDDPAGVTRVAVVTFESRQGPGIPYALEVELARDGYPFVVYVDAEGWPSVLFPISAPAFVPAGYRALLPDPSGAVTWWTDESLEGAAVLVAVADRPNLSVARLSSLVERAAAEADDPDSARERVEKVLRRRLGPTVMHPLHLAANPSK